MGLVLFWTPYLQAAPILKSYNLTPPWIKVSTNSLKINFEAPLLLISFGNPVFDTNSTEQILQDLYTQYIQDQGVAAGNKSNLKNKSNSKSKSKSTSKSDFGFQIIFAPERKLQDAKLKKAMDDFYGYAPGTTKMIKSKPDKLPDMKDVDDGSTQYPLGTYVCIQSF